MIGNFNTLSRKKGKLSQQVFNALQYVVKKYMRFRNMVAKL